MKNTNLNILMLMFQPSVVARGLEKNLVDLGHTVETVIGDFSKIEVMMENSDLCVFNLPNKIAENKKELKDLVLASSVISVSGKSLIFVGEKESRNELLNYMEDVDKYPWVYRPVEINDLMVAITKTQKNNPNAKKKRILIVDDDPDYAKMVRDWIKDSYKVDIVTAGMQAISFLLKVPKEERVDLILLDYEMPVVDGPQVFQMLKQEPATSKIPVVFLTGVGSREGVARVMALKPAGYILKSTTRDDLLAFLDSKLGE